LTKAATFDRKVRSPATGFNLESASARKRGERVPDIEAKAGV
jgi:hypothetical protein